MNKKIVWIVVLLLVFVLVALNNTPRKENEIISWHKEKRSLDIIAQEYNLSATEKYCLAGVLGQLSREDINPKCNFSSRLINATEDILFSKKLDRKD